jgi:hypothetical protein
MPRVNHFVIPADVTDRAINFYQEVFGWQFEVGWEYDTSQGREKYWRVITGDGASAGINGGLTRREYPGPTHWRRNRSAGSRCVHGSRREMRRENTSGQGWSTWCGFVCCVSGFGGQHLRDLPARSHCPVNRCARSGIVYGASGSNPGLARLLLVQRRLLRTR